jgi:hypothetical protein
VAPRGEIHIAFPSTNYAELPYPPYLTTCSLSGAITSFQSCYLQGSTYIIVLDSPYDEGVITFSIDNVVNPPWGVSDGFSISTYFDEVLLEATDESTLFNRTITFMSEPLPLLINQIDFAPTNRGVPSTYLF